MGGSLGQGTEDLPLCAACYDVLVTENLGPRLFEDAWPHCVALAHFCECGLERSSIVAGLVGEVAVYGDIGRHTRDEHLGG